MSFAMLSSNFLIVAVLVSVHLVLIPSCYGRTLEDVGPETEDDHGPVLCAPNTYYSKGMEKCVVCSECPVNTIITSPCHRFQDTKCGSYYDFNAILAILEAGRENTHSDSQAEDRGEDLGTGAEDATTRPNIVAEWKTVAVKLSLIITGFVLILAIIIVGGVCFIRRKYINVGKGGVVCEYSPAPEANPVQEC